jgi:hypothetical protein
VSIVPLVSSLLPLSTPTIEMSTPSTSDLEYTCDMISLSTSPTPLSVTGEDTGFCGSK